MGIRMSGLSSGMDTEAIVKELMSAQSMKKNKVVKAKTKLEWTQTKWSELNTKLTGLYNNFVSKMQLSTAYKTKKTTVSDATKASVAAKTSAANGNYSMEIKNVATSQYLTGAKINASASDKLTDIDSSLLNKEISITVGTKTTKFAVTADTTLKDFTSALQSAGLNANFDDAQKGRQYFKENVLLNHDTLPIGEFAIGTNTTAYVTAKKYGIEDKMPILIAEKMGPHFAVGDTCYSWCEDIKVYNPNGKEIIARDNSVSIRRKEDVSKAYFHCHTDITIPYEELGSITVITKDKKEITLLENGKFVLPGTEILNEPLKNSNK